MTSPSSSFDSDDLPLALSAKRRKILSTASSNERNSPLNIYGVPGPSSDNRNWDKYCWICHRKSFYEIKCSNCVLSFHAGCVTDINRKNIGWKCPDCKMIDSDQHRDLRGHSLKHIVKKLTEYINEDPVETRLPEVIYEDSPRLIKRLTTDDIEEKVKKSKYISIHDLLVDFKWIHHNCEILHLCSGKDEKEKTKKLLTRSKEILKKCFNQIKIFEQCYDCYEFGTNEPHQMCSKPHNLIWVKYGDYPYWPSKLLHIRKGAGCGKQPIEVFFFGDNQAGSVECDRCFFYSEEDPNNDDDIIDKEGYERSKVEALKYIKKIEEKYGRFVYAPFKTKLTIKNIEQWHHNMIPGYETSNQQEPKIENYNELLQELNINFSCNDDDYAKTSVEDSANETTNSSLLTPEACSSGGIENDSPNESSTESSNNNNNIPQDRVTLLIDLKEKQKKSSKKDHKKSSKNYVNTDKLKKRMKKMSEHASSLKEEYEFQVDVNRQIQENLDELGEEYLRETTAHDDLKMHYANERAENEELRAELSKMKAMLIKKEK